MKRIFLISILFLTILQRQSIMAQCNAPIVNNFSPNTGFIGSTVTINGANFDAIPGNNQVFFGATKADILTSSFGVMTVKVPVGATLAPISVKNGCNKIAYSSTAFNGIFCPTPINNTTYSSTNFSMSAYGAYNMLSQDMDLDGKPDVISGGTGGTTIAKNNSTPGNLNFSRFDLARPTQGIAVADFDGDGKRDLLVGYSGVYVLRNTSIPGTLSFAPETTVSGGIGAYQIAAGDFNGDGKIDIATGAGGNVYTFLNTSTGIGNISFTQNSLVYVGTTCTGFQVADVDGDGKTDILATQGGANRAVTIRNTTTLNSTTFTFETPEYWPSNGEYPYRCMIADFDKDGKIDLTTCNYNGATNTAIFRNTSTFGDISFAPTVNLVAPQNNYRIGVGDANGDGYPDIVTKSLGINAFSVYPNTSTGAGNVSFSQRFDYSSSNQAEVSGIVIADLDGDFVPDIATSGINSNEIRFHRNTSYQIDNTPPTAMCKNITVALSPSGTVNVTAQMIDNGSGDACGIGTIKINGQSSINFNCSNIGNNSVTLTVTDRSGNTATCTAVVTVAPAAIIVAGQTTVCQGQTVLMNANLGDSYQWYNNGLAINGATSQSYTATATGNYSVRVINQGGCSGISSELSVVVNLNPTVSTTPSNIAYLCPSNLNIVASQSSTYQWYLNNTIINGATGQSHNATTVGTYSVKVIDLFGCSATSPVLQILSGGPEIDLKGNGNSIVDGDITPSTSDATDFGLTYPSVSTPKTFTISNSGPNTLNISSIVVSGANASNYTINGINLPADIASGSSLTFNVTFLGSAITTYTATVNVNSNDCNESIYDFKVKTQISCATPIFNACPASLIVNTDPESCSAQINYQSIVTGTPTPILSYSMTGATLASGSGNGSGTIGNLGNSTVTIFASSSCGSTSCTFNVLIQDKTAPVVITKNITVQLDATGNTSITAEDIENGSTDACGIATLTVSPSTFNCSNVGVNTVTLTATDVNGNVSSTSSIVTVEDKVAPVVITKNITVQLDATGNTSITAADVNNGSTDACGIATLTVNPSTFNCSNVGENTVTLTATDVNGNVSSSTAIVTVEDKVAPLLITKNITVKLDATGNTSITATDLNNGSTDACGIATLTVNPSTFNCSNIGENTVTLTATDVNGNASSTSSIVTVEDKVAPVVITKNITVQLDASGNTYITAADVENGSTDACGITTLTVNPSTFNCSNVGVNTVTLTATDVNGNVSSTNAIVTVEDKVAPVVICKNISVTLVNGTVSINGYQVDNGSNDACGISSLTVSPSTFNCSNIGNNTVMLSATDVNGNVSTCTSVVNVIGAIPVVTIAQTVLPDFCQGGAIVLTSSSINPVSFDWSTGSNTNPTNVYSSGTYSVTVTNNYGCSSSASTVVNYNASNLFSSYSILANNATLSINSKLLSGGLGITTPILGTANVTLGSTVTGVGTFVKAPIVNSLTGTVTNKINSVTSVPMPDFKENNNYFGTVLVVAPNANVTISQSVFSSITIGYNARVTFTSPEVYASSITMFDNSSIEFEAACPRVMIRGFLTTGINCKVNNSNTKSVVFYVTGNVLFGMGNTFNASSYTKGILTSNGTLLAPNNLKGMFIANVINANTTNFNWNSVCGSCSLVTTKSLVDNTVESTSNNEGTSLQINVYPNPSNGSLTISSDVQGTYMIMNELGQELQTIDLNEANNFKVNVSNLSDGIYFVYGVNNNFIVREKFVVTK